MSFHLPKFFVQGFSGKSRGRRLGPLILTCPFGIGERVRLAFLFLILPLFAQAARPISQVANSLFHRCVRFNDGGVKCWGSTERGYIGVNSGKEWVTDPTRLPDVDLPGPAVDLAVGMGHSCVLLRDSSIYCWGSNFFGQLGQSTSESESSLGKAYRVTSIPQDVVPVKLHLSVNRSCALTTTGSYWCWGADKGKQEFSDRVRSIGETSGPHCAILENGAVECLPFYYFSRQLWEGRQASKIQGGYGLCALLENQQVECTGNFAGAPNKTIEIDFGNLLPVKDFACSSSHCCAVFNPTRTMKCWGANSAGELGTSDFEDRRDPETFSERLSYVPLGRNERIKFLSVGYRNTCIVTEANQVRCWGYGIEGARPTMAEDSPLFSF